MAVPKRKMGRARTHARRSTNDKIAAPSRSVCPQCGEVKLPHRVCPHCGFYKNREVIETEERTAHARAFCRRALTSLLAHRASRAMRREAFLAFRRSANGGTARHCEALMHLILPLRVSSSRIEACFLEGVGAAPRLRWRNIRYLKASR